MSRSVPSEGHSPSEKPGEVLTLEEAPPPKQAHPAPVEYVKIATVLVVVTVFEVSVYYMAALRGALVPILLVLSAIKFSLVALWYMHLKFDSRLFSALFTGGLALAGVVLIALMFLFRVFYL